MVLANDPIVEQIEKIPSIIEAHLPQIQGWFCIGHFPQREKRSSPMSRSKWHKLAHVYSKEEQKSILSNAENAEDVKYKMGHRFRSSIKKHRPVYLLKYTEDGDNKLRLARSDPSNELATALVLTFDILIREGMIWGMHMSGNDLSQTSSNLDFVSFADDVVKACRIEVFDVNDLNIIVNEIIQEAVQRKGKPYKRELIRPIIKRKHDGSVEGAGAVKFTFEGQYDEGNKWCFQFQKIDFQVSTMSYYCSPFSLLEARLKELDPYVKKMEELKKIAKQVKEAFEKHEIVPQIFPNAPERLIKMAFDSGVEANLGNVLTPNQVKDKPHLNFTRIPKDSPHIYTVALIDLDLPSREDPSLRQWLHWLVINMEEKNKKGEILAEYIGAGPPPNTGLHRYVLLTYKQKQFITNPEQEKLDMSIDKRAQWRVEQFAEKHQLELIGGNFFQAEFDDYVPDLYEKLGIKVKGS